jgi:hypothetical protein
MIVLDVLKKKLLSNAEELYSVERHKALKYVLPIA